MNKQEKIKLNKRMIITLNQLMRREEISDFDQKPFPYLGWYWRDIDDYEAEGLPMSYYGGIWWLDEAGKWDYPKQRLDVDQTTLFLQIALASVGQVLKYVSFSKSLPNPKLDIISDSVQNEVIT